MSAGAATHTHAEGVAPGNNPKLADQILADAYCHLVRTLCLALPPPLTDSPEDLRRRDHAAIARLAALAPANAAEAELGGQFVAASEQWKACWRLAEQPGAAPEWAAKCRAQGASMMRQANSALGLLQRMQSTRRKLEADSTARDRLAWTEHCALGLMAEALAQPTTPPASCEPAPASRPDPLAPEAEQNAEPAVAAAAPAPQSLPAEAVAPAAESPRIEPSDAAGTCPAIGGPPPHRRAA